MEPDGVQFVQMGKTRDVFFDRPALLIQRPG